MPTNDSLPCGLYETLLDEDLAALLESRPDLLATLVAVDDESAPHTSAKRYRLQKTNIKLKSSIV